MVGELGCIFGTTDGGKTWKVQQTGGQRAAVLCLHASHRSTPLDVVSLLGLGEGYRCAAVGLMSADPATSDPKRAADAARLRQAMRLAGGVSGDVGWAFPVAAHAAGLPPRDLMASWDRAHGGKAAEQLLRQAVLAIRTWQPEVIVADSTRRHRIAVRRARFARREGSLQAGGRREVLPRADRDARSEAVGREEALRPHERSEGRARAAGSEHLQRRAGRLAEGLRRTRDANPGRRIRRRPTAGLRAGRAPARRREEAHRPHGRHRARSRRLGTTARECDRDSTRRWSEEQKKAIQSRRRLETMASINDPEIAGADKLVAVLGAEVKKMPDDTAARTTYAVATRLARDGKWAEAREVYGLLASQYPGHPLAIEAFRWLTRYHASSEARRRTEIQQKLLIKSVAFESLPGAEKVIATGGTSAQATAPTVREDQYRIYSPEAILQWHQSCLDLEPKHDRVRPGSFARSVGVALLPRRAAAGRPAQRRDHVRPRLLQEHARRGRVAARRRSVARLPRGRTVDDRPEPDAGSAEAARRVQAHRSASAARRQARRCLLARCEADATRGRVCRSGQAR